MKGRPLWGEVVAGVEVGIAEELEHIPVKGFHPGLCDDVDDATSEAAVLGIHVAGKNVELSHRIEVGNDARLLADRLLHAGAIQVVGVI
jgi:hypothetical protein